MKKKRARQVKRANNVFLDLGFPPHEAAVMLLRCELAEALRKWMDREAISQVEAAKRLGVVQPRISEIARNKVDKLSLDYLVGLDADNPPDSALARLETDRPHAVRQAILSCRKGGSVFVLGVFSALVDKFPLGAVMNKGLTLRAAQQHGERYIPMLLERMANGDPTAREALTERFLPLARDLALRYSYTDERYDDNGLMRSLRAHLGDTPMRDATEPSAPGRSSWRFTRPTRPSVSSGVVGPCGRSAPPSCASPPVRPWRCWARTVPARQRCWT